MPRFDIIITVWNRLDLTKETISSLFASGAARDCERLIIVDNRSTEEGTPEFLESLYRDYGDISNRLWLLHRGKNDGWGTAINDALGLSRGPYVIIANNDVTFDLGFHRVMFETLEGNLLGLLGAWRHINHTVTVEHEKFDEMTDVPAVCWLIPKVVMEHVGMLKENGPCFTKGGNGEDSDYVARVKAAGFLAGATKKDIAHHIQGY